MAYPTGVVFQPTNGAPIGMQPITESSTTKRHELGTRVLATDVNYGECWFVYLIGVASTAKGDAVVYNSKTGATVRAVAGGATSVGSVAVAMSDNGASSYGWYAVAGSVPVAAATALADTQACLSATAGTIDDATSASAVLGMTIKAATSGGFATCQLSNPTVSTNTGANSGDVSLAAIGAVPNANGASLSGQALTLQPADASFGGVVTTAAQAFAGAKTFDRPVSTGSGGSGVPDFIAYNGCYQSISNTTTELRGTQNDGAGAVGCRIGAPAYTNVTSNIAEFALNYTANKLRIDLDGVLTYPTGAAAAVAGTKTLVAGVGTVSTTAVKATSIILITPNTLGGTFAAGGYQAAVADIVAGTSFVIRALKADGTAETASTATVNWFIVNKTA